MLTRHESAIQLKNQQLVSGQRQKTLDLNELWTLTRDMFMWYWSADTLFWQVSIGHVRYINILTWLPCFQVKPLYLVLFSLYLTLFWEFRDKGNLKNLQFWPESLGAMLEYWYIEHGLLIITWMSNIKVHSKPRLHVSVNLLFGVWPPCCATPLPSLSPSCIRAHEQYH